RVGAAAGVVPGAVGGQVLYDARGGGEFERVQGGVEVAGGPVERGGVAADAAVLVELGAVVEAEVGDGDGVDFDRDLAGDGAAVLAGGHERVGGGRGGGHLAGAAGVDGLAVEGDALGGGDAPGEGGGVSPDHAGLVAGEAGLEWVDVRDGAGFGDAAAGGVEGRERVGRRARDGAGGAAVVDGRVG